MYDYKNKTDEQETFSALSNAFTSFNQYTQLIDENSSQ